MDNEHSPSLFGLIIDEESTGTLKSACQWARVLGILGMILAALVLLLGFIMYNKLVVTYSSNAYGSSAMKTVAMRYLIICIMMAAVFVTGGIFTLNFASRISTALHTNDQQSLNSGLAAIKSLVIFWAVIFIVFIILLLLAFIGLASV